MHTREFLDGKKQNIQPINQNITFALHGKIKLKITKNIKCLIIYFNLKENSYKKHETQNINNRIMK